MALANSLSLADLEAMPDDGRRYELIGGAIVMTPAPGPAHQRVSRRLQALLEAATAPGHEVFAAPIDLDLPGEQRVQPDLVVDPAADEITALRLDHNGAYQTYGQGQGVTLDWPVAIEIDITALRQPPA
ncbi:MAG: Uma2 family endonuclease [Acidimicrobiia bacterium]